LEHPLRAIRAATGLAHLSEHHDERDGSRQNSQPVLHDELDSAGDLVGINLSDGQMKTLTTPIFLFQQSWHPNRGHTVTPTEESTVMSLHRKVSEMRRVAPEVVDGGEPPDVDRPITALSSGRYDDLAAQGVRPGNVTGSVTGLTSALVDALSGNDSIGVSRTALLLGVLCQTAPDDDNRHSRETVRGNLPIILSLLETARLTPASRLGLLHFFAHFPEDRELITSALNPDDYESDDMTRLRRCLRPADFADPSG
jgi:hypothetical protein